MVGCVRHREGILMDLLSSTCLPVCIFRNVTLCVGHLVIMGLRGWGSGTLEIMRSRLCTGDDMGLANDSRQLFSLSLSPSLISCPVPMDHRCCCCCVKWFWCCGCVTHPFGHLWITSSYRSTPSLAYIIDRCLLLQVILMGPLTVPPSTLSAHLFCLA